MIKMKKTLRNIKFDLNWLYIYIYIYIYSIHQSFLLDTQATIECRLTLKLMHDTIITYGQIDHTDK